MNNKFYIKIVIIYPVQYSYFVNLENLGKDTRKMFDKTQADIKLSDPFWKDYELVVESVLPEQG